MTTVLQETAIRNWLMAITGFSGANVFLRDQSGPRPNTAYATFKFLTGTEADYSGKKITKDTVDPTLLKEEWFQRESMTYQIDIYAEDGKDIFKKLWLSRGVRQIRSLLGAGGITLSARSITRNLTELQDTGYAPRYNADFTFIGETNLDVESDLGYLNELMEEYETQAEWQPDVPVVIES